MAAFVGGSAQYFAAVAPIVQSGGMSKTAAVTIYSAFARNFKLGKEVDAVLDALADEADKAEKMAAQQPPPTDPELEKIKAQIEGDKARLQIEMQKAQMDGQIKQADMQMKAQGAQDDGAMKQQTAQQDFSLKREIALLDMELKKIIAMEELQLKKMQADSDAKLKTRGQDNLKQDSADMTAALGSLGKLIADGNKQTGQLIAQSNQQLVKALTAPKSVVTPDGRVYTAQTNRMQ
jgi:hypothetical protein